MIQKNANRLLRVINQILDFRKVEGKQEKLAVREIDLVPFVGEIKSYFDSMARYVRSLYVHFFDKTMYAMDRSGPVGEGICQSSLERL